MKAGGRNRVVLVTCGALSEGRKIARRVTQKRLAACVSVLLSPMKSYFVWKNKPAVAREYLLVMKTTSNRLPQLEKEVKRIHRYEVPEFIALPITDGSLAYLSWVQQSVGQPQKRAMLLVAQRNHRIDTDGAPRGNIPRGKGHRKK